MTEIDDDTLGDWPLPQPDAGADKSERGHALVIAGSAEMPGAAWLAAIAALRAGAGKLVVATAASVAPGLALRLPEARVIALPENERGGFVAAGLELVSSLLGQVDGVVVGPGMEDEAATRAFVAGLIERIGDASLVLDALAMDVATAASRFPRPPLLTPHAGEMAHLYGIGKDEVERDGERIACDAAARWNAVVALKGSTTIIATPDGQVFRHRGGNSGLATSGSGDVLAGILCGLAARGAPLEQAAAWGVALHARAGAALALSRGPLGYLASELPAEVPRLMDRLGKGETRR